MELSCCRPFHAGRHAQRHGTKHRRGPRVVDVEEAGSAPHDVSLFSPPFPVSILRYPVAVVPRIFEKLSSVVRDVGRRSSNVATAGARDHKGRRDRRTPFRGDVKVNTSNLLNVCSTIVFGI